MITILYIPYHKQQAIADKLRKYLKKEYDGFYVVKTSTTKTKSRLRTL